MKKAFLAAAMAATTILSPLATAGHAEAATKANPCAQIRTTNVGGFNYSTMPTGRLCSDTLKAGVAGQALLAKKQVLIQYSSSRTSNVEAQKATVHELTHHVEYRTTAAHRAKLYSFIGVKNPSGNYFAINDKYYYSGSLALWKQSPRERLAESVVNCKFGTPNHKGMALVPKARCSAFLSEYKAALAVAR